MCFTQASCPLSCIPSLDIHPCIRTEPHDLISTHTYSQVLLLCWRLKFKNFGGWIQSTVVVVVSKLSHFRVRNVHLALPIKHNPLMITEWQNCIRHHFVFTLSESQSHADGTVRQPLTVQRPITGARYARRKRNLEVNLLSLPRSHSGSHEAQCSWAGPVPTRSEHVWGVGSSISSHVLAWLLPVWNHLGALWQSLPCCVHLLESRLKDKTETKLSQRTFSKSLPHGCCYSCIQIVQREPSLAWPELPTPLEDVQHTKPFKTSSPRVLVPSLLAVGTFV